MIKGPAWLIPNRAFLCLLILLLATKAALAATPLQTHDLNPLTLVYGLPLISPAKLPAPGQSFFSASFNFSNTLNVEDTTNENLFIDGETNELNLIYLFSINDKTRMRLRIPFISHRAGSLDNFIDDFHDTFGFPGGKRPDYPIDQFLFSYTRDGVERLHMDKPNNGIGDISIDAAYQLYADSSQAGSVWTSIKLPSGDDKLLTGSGKLDASLWLSAESNFAQDWSNYYNIGLLIPGKSNILPELQKSEVYFGTAGIEWRAMDNLTLNIQLDFHSAFYQSKTKFLGDSVQISSGGHIRLSTSQRIEIVVVEDIYVGASPDVTFQLGYSQLF